MVVAAAAAAVPSRKGECLEGDDENAGLYLFGNDDISENHYGLHVGDLGHAGEMKERAG